MREDEHLANRLADDASVTSNADGSFLLGVIYI